MRIAIGNDHRGYGMKLKLAELLTQLGHTATDEGAHGIESCDYPDIASVVARAVSTAFSTYRRAVSYSPRCEYSKPRLLYSRS